MLSDRDFINALEHGSLSIDPFHVKNLQPCSYDLTLGTSFQFFEPKRTIDPSVDQRYSYRRVVMDKLELQPGRLLLGCTNERVALDAYLAARVEGKSSLARLGLIVHTTAGFIDAGFAGQITLELFNMASMPIKLSAHMPIAQLSVFRLDTPAGEIYAGKYQDQEGATESRYYLNRYVNQ